MLTAFTLTYRGILIRVISHNRRNIRYTYTIPYEIKHTLRRMKIIKLIIFSLNRLASSRLLQKSRIRTNQSKKIYLLYYYITESCK